MAFIGIDDLPAVTVPALTDTFPVTQGGTAKKETLTQVNTLITSSLDVYKEQSTFEVKRLTITTATSATVTFLVKRPGMFWLQGVLDGTATSMVLTTDQNGGTRTVSSLTFGGAGTQTNYGIALNPGTFALTFAAAGSRSGTLILYCSGAYGISSMDASRIVT
jgi:hypothetical protein